MKTIDQKNDNSLVFLQLKSLNKNLNWQESKVENKKIEQKMLFFLDQSARFNKFHDFNWNNKLKNLCARFLLSST